MSKEEFLKIQKCVLKVNIHCDGCKHKVKKILQKIDGVFTTEIDAEQGKVTVSGNVDPNVLIKKLAKSGKHAELWGAPKANNNNNHNQNHLANQLKNLQIDNAKHGVNTNNNNNNKAQNHKIANNQQKGGGGGGGGGGQQGPNPQQLQQQQQLQMQLQQQQRLQQHLQQLQQMKSLQDLNPPQFKGLKLPPQNPNAKPGKFDVPEEDDDFTDDELDDYDDDEDFDDEFYDEMDALPPVKMMKPPMTGNAAHMMLNPQKPGNNNGGGGNGKKGGGSCNGPVPVQMHGMVGVNDGKNSNGGKKGVNNQNHGGNGNKNNGGGIPEGKNGAGVGVGGGGGGNKNGNNGGNMNNNQNNGGKKGIPMGVQAMNNGFQNIGGPHLMSGANPNMTMPMPNIPAVQGLPAGGAGGGYFQGAAHDVMPGNPYHQQQQQQQQQQQYLAAMMNQQRAMGNQPMMYARPPPAVNYMYPPYPYPPPDPYYTHFFSDENTSSCNVM